MPFSNSQENPEYIDDVLAKAGFARDRIEAVKEDTYQRFRDIHEMATIKTKLFTTLVKDAEGWTSPTAKEEFTVTLTKNLLSFDRFHDNVVRRCFSKDDSEYCHLQEAITAQSFEFAVNHFRDTTASHCIVLEVSPRICLTTGMTHDVSSFFL